MNNGFWLITYQTVNFATKLNNAVTYDTPVDWLLAKRENKPDSLYVLVNALPISRDEYDALRLELPS